jgi:hypothetical protein
MESMSVLTKQAGFVTHFDLGPLHLTKFNLVTVHEVTRYPPQKTS